VAPAQVASPVTKRPAAKATGEVADNAASKSANKAAGQPAGKAAVPQTKRSQARGKAGRAEKAPKLYRKPVRDSFTMPEADFSLIALLKARTLAAGRATKKSELLRAGLQALAALPVAALVASLERLEPIKIGRPARKTGT
jgi:hypothetical protein